MTTQKDPPRLPVIPQTAVQLSREGRSVLIVRDDDTIERRMITVAADGGSEGTLDPGEVAVTQGLTGGEDVVVRGAATLKEGQKVSPRPANAQAGNGNAGPEAARPEAGQPQDAGKDGATKGGETAAGKGSGGSNAAGGGTGGGGSTE